MSRSVVLVVGCWPRTSETFVLQEILGLERRGVELCLVSLKEGGRALHPMYKDVRAPILYLPERLHWQPLRVCRSLRRVLGMPRRGEIFRTLWEDLKRISSIFMWRKLLRRFGQACVLATERREIGFIYAHFLHKPAEVAYYTSIIRGVSWSFSAHAVDIWKTSEAQKRRKLLSAAWGVTCTRQALTHLQTLTHSPQKLTLLYHGLDFSRFPSYVPSRAWRDGSEEGLGVRIVTVCRIVEKKGLDVLLAALSRLPRSLFWEWYHVGDGQKSPKLLRTLQKQAKRQGLSTRIHWLGERSQQEVIEEYIRADVFVLPCKKAKDGDQDGLPNVLMEAQILGLPCISTFIGGIPELIIPHKTGLLVPSNQVTPLADALKILLSQPERRVQLGKSASLHIKQYFDCQKNLDWLAHKLIKSIPNSG